MHLGTNIKLFGNPLHGGKIPCSITPSNYIKNPLDVLYGLCEVETRGFANTLAA
jgi:hypothetical protein